MWILPFAMLAVILHQRPDGHKLLTTIAHRRDPDLARAAPLPPTDRSELDAPHRCRDPHQPHRTRIRRDPSERNGPFQS